MKTPKNKLYTTAFLLGVLLMPMHLFAQLPIMLDSNYVSFYLFEGDDATTSYGQLQYHFVQQVQLFDSITEFKFNKHIDEGGPPDYCNKLSKPSFAGSYVQLNNNGNITVFNRNQEPILFNMNAPLDSSWLMYDNRAQNNIVKASIISAYDSTIFNQGSEIKGIQIVFYDTLGKEKRQERFNRFVFLYGNNIGFLRLCYLGSFPSTCVNAGYDSCKIFRFAGYQNIEGTVKQGKTYFHLNELHDYEVGDEFHSLDVYSSQFSNSKIKTINTCILKEEINDTIYFTFKERKHAIKWDRNGRTPKYTDTIEEREHQVSRPLLNIRPFEIGNYRENQQNVYTCGILDGYYFDENYKFMTPHANDSCFAILLGAVDNNGYFFKGIYGHNYQYGPFASGSREIVYYKKGSKTWGTPLPQNIGINENAQIKTVNVYPNPTNNVAVIGINEVKSLTVYNSLGVAVWVPVTVFSNQVELNTTNLTNGVYFILLQNKQGLARCSLMVQHN